MAVTTEIKTGNRSVISFMLSPLTRYVHEKWEGTVIYNDVRIQYRSTAVGVFRTNLRNLFLIYVFALLIISDTPAVAGESIFSVLIPAPSDPEATLDLVYADSQNHLVMQYDLGRIENDRIYFTNGRSLFDLTDADSYALANTPGLLTKFVSSKGLTALQNMYMGTAEYGSYPLHIEVRSAPKCQWPYDSKLVIKRNGARPLEVMFFRRRSLQTSGRYQIWCEAGPGTIDLTTRFDNVPIQLLLDKNGSPVVAVSKPPLVLDLKAGGEGISINSGSGVFAVPASWSDDLFAKVAEGKMSAQEAVETLDAELDTAEKQ